jgi:hypothetical protein
VRTALGALQAGELPAGAEIEGWRHTLSDLEIFSERVKLLMEYSVLDTMDSGLSKLSQQLCDFFASTNACLLFYSPGERQFQSYNGGVEFPKEGPERFSLKVMEGSFLDMILNSRQANFAELSDLPREDATLLSRVAANNILIGPLYYRREIFGVIALADKKGGWTIQDQRHLEALEDSLSRLVNNLLLSERYRKIDLLRREYCMELSKAVEIPLHRIKEEVQAIHSRLGRLTPYFKEHCESILFEVGVLYQIAQETRDQEAERDPAKALLKLPGASATKNTKSS